MNVNVVVPELPSASATSLIESVVEPPEHGASVEAVLRGFGVPDAKSAAFWSTSVQPLAALRTAAMLEGAGVGPVPSKQFAVVPKPTKSTIDPPVGQAPESAVVALRRATLPTVALIEIVPVASGVGRFVVPPAPCAS